MDKRTTERRTTEFCNVNTHCLYEDTIKNIPHSIEVEVSKVKSELLSFLKPYVSMIEKVHERLLVGNGKDSIQTQVAVNSQNIDVLTQSVKQMSDSISKLTVVVSEIKENERLNSEFRKDSKRVILKAISYSVVSSLSLLFIIYEVFINIGAGK